MIMINSADNNKKINVDGINKTTILALDEFDDMLNNPKKYKRYSSFKEVIEDIIQK